MFKSLNRIHAREGIQTLQQQGQNTRVPSSPSPSPEIQQAPATSRAITQVTTPLREEALVADYLTLQARDPQSLTEAETVKYHQLQKVIKAQEKALKGWKDNKAQQSTALATREPSSQSTTSAQAPSGNRLLLTQASTPQQKSTSETPPSKDLLALRSWKILKNIISTPERAGTSIVSQPRTNTDQRTQQPTTQPPKATSQFKPIASTDSPLTPTSNSSTTIQSSQPPAKHHKPVAIRPSTIASSAATSISTFPENIAPSRREVPFQELYTPPKRYKPDAETDPILQKVTVKQIPEDASHFRKELAFVLHEMSQADAKAILSRITVHVREDGKEYYVKFPGQEKEIPVTLWELQQPGGANSNTRAVRILEIAYLKIPGVRPGEPNKNILNTIFNQNNVTASTTVTKQPSKSPPPRPARRDLDNIQSPPASKVVKTSSQSAASPPPQQVSQPFSLATIAVSGEGTRLGTELSIQELYGDDFRKIKIHQGTNSNTCYLLSSLDSILHLPPEKAKALLSRIKISQNDDQYYVQFPGQPDVIPVKRNELSQPYTVHSQDSNGTWPGHRVDSNSLGIQLIEAAYLKIIPPRQVGHIDDPYKALSRIFGTDEALTNIQNSLGNSPEMNHYVLGGLTFTNREECHAHFKDLIRIAMDPSTKDYANVADILTAIPIREQQTVHQEHNGQLYDYQAPTGDHYYSVRLHDSTPTEIVLFNSLNPTKLITKHFDDFMREYNIEGMRLNLD